MQEWYHSWWWIPRKMSRKQIQEMLDNMKKSEIVNKKSKEYHKKEELEAEDILKKLDS